MTSLGRAVVVFNIAKGTQVRFNTHSHSVNNFAHASKVIRSPRTAPTTILYPVATTNIAAVQREVHAVTMTRKSLKSLPHP